MSDVCFGPFSLDAAATRLLRNGTEVKLRPQALQALRVLLRYSGRAVPYEEMIAQAWQGTVVSRHTVDVTVGEVKRSLQEYGGWISTRAKVGHRLDVPKSDELVRKGWHFWNRRTRGGFERAIDCFERAAEESPSDSRAFEGLSAAYLMLATGCMRPPQEMYPGFLDAHERAIELGPLTPALRCNRAHGLHMFERRHAEAESEFLATLAEDSGLASAYVRLAMLYCTLGRTDDALGVLGRGFGVDPLWPMLHMTEATVRFWRREFDAAITLGASAVELHPYLHTARTIYAQALEFSGRHEDALAQYRIASVVSPDLPWLRAHEGICLAKMGRVSEARAILEGLEQLRRTDYVDAFFMAVFREAVGQRDEAYGELERAAAENSARLYSLDIDPKMDCLRNDPRFERVRDALFKNTDGERGAGPAPVATSQTPPLR
jgi:DNA-binding winged helix-turn-helix (wHTH) protein